MVRLPEIKGLSRHSSLPEALRFCRCGDRQGRLQGWEKESSSRESDGGLESVMMCSV